MFTHIDKCLFITSASTKQQATQFIIRFAESVNHKVHKEMISLEAF